MENSKASLVNDKRLAIAIILIALNLRAPFLAITPLITMVSQELHLDNSALGLLTTLPLLVFGGLSSFLGVWANRYGVGSVLWGALGFLLLGEVIRYEGSVQLLYLGTILIAVGAAAGNVLIPALIKAFFPQRIGLMTSLYSSLMGVVTAVSIAVAVPLATYLGWREALYLFFWLTLGSMLFWVPYRKLTFAPSLDKKRDISIKEVFTQPLAWFISLYMGIQSFMFYCYTTWMPALLFHKGLDAEMGGYFAFVFQTLSLLFSFFTPMIVASVQDQRYHAICAVGAYTCGTLLLYVAQSWMMILLSVIVLGIGAGATFGIALVYFGVRTKSARTSAILSGVGQAIGYVLAAIGPVLLGYLYDVTQAWTWGMGILFVGSLIFMWLGYEAGKDRFIKEDKVV